MVRLCLLQDFQHPLLGSTVLKPVTNFTAVSSLSGSNTVGLEILQAAIAMQAVNIPGGVH